MTLLQNPLLSSRSLRAGTASTICRPWRKKESTKERLQHVAALFSCHLDPASTCGSLRSLVHVSKFFLSSLPPLGYLSDTEVCTVVIHLWKVEQLSGHMSLDVGLGPFGREFQYPQYSEPSLGSKVCEPSLERDPLKYR